MRRQFSLCARITGDAHKLPVAGAHEVKFISVLGAHKLPGKDFRRTLRSTLEVTSAKPEAASHDSVGIARCT